MFLDRWLFALINSSRHVLLDWFMPLFSNTPFLWGIALWGFVVFGLRFGWRRAGIIALGVALAVAGSDSLTYAVKKAVSRPRPLAVEHGVWAYGDGEGWRQWGVPPGGGRSSFPSAHVANAMAAVWVLVALGRLSRVAFFFPCAVAYSRIYVGKHYPVDVIGGLVVGLVVGVVVVMTIRRLYRQDVFAP